MSESMTMKATMAAAELAGAVEMARRLGLPEAWVRAVEAAHGAAWEVQKWVSEREEPGQF